MKGRPVHRRRCALIAAIRSLPGITRTITSIAHLTIKERGATGWLD